MNGFTTQQQNGLLERRFSLDDPGGEVDFLA